MTPIARVRVYHSQRISRGSRAYFGLAMRECSEEEAVKEQRFLTNRIMRVTLGRPFSTQVADRVDEVIREHGTACRMKGYKFPSMVAVWLPAIGKLEVVFRDLDRKGVETLIVNLTRKWPQVSREDLGFGIARAFPEYRTRIMAEHAERNRSCTHH
jgi:hypothetical protein